MAAPEHPESRAITATSQLAEGKHSILIVDDEEENLDFLSSALRKGNLLFKASSGEEALPIVDGETIHMVITDYRMPGITGVELLARMKVRQPDAIRILITGYTDTKIAVEAINEGEVHRYIQKPVDPKELQMIVRSELERFDLREQTRRLTQDLLKKNEELQRVNDELVRQKDEIATLADEYKRQKDLSQEMSNKYASANRDLLEMQEEMRAQNRKLETVNRKLERLSITDGLTGFFNQRHLHVLLDNEIGRAKRYDLKLSCMMVDLDYFKEVNDRYGHLVGDQVLKKITTVIRENIRDTDMPARYGGDEFIIILPHTGVERAVYLAKRIHREILSYYFTTPQGRFQQTVSIGIAFFPHSQVRTKEDLIRVVDEALYRAKEAGRNRVVVYQ